MAKKCQKCQRDLAETAKLKINVKQTNKHCKVCIAEASNPTKTFRLDSNM